MPSPLAPEERVWLQSKLDAERRQNVAEGVSGLRLMRDGPAILMTIIYVMIGFGVYANVFFLPLIIKDLGFSNIATSYLSAMPAALGVAGMIIFSRSSDRTGERVWHVTVPTFLAAVGLLLAGATTGNKVAELGALCLVGFAISGCLPTFWNLPTAYFGAGAAAAGIAVINSIGNISGYFAPQLVGILRDRTGSYATGMLVVGAMVLVAAVLLPLAGAPIRAATRLRRATA
jgi:ACS family tartrate transporter-like MFS transporter